MKSPQLIAPHRCLANHKLALFFFIFFYPLTVIADTTWQAFSLSINHVKKLERLATVGAFRSSSNQESDFEGKANVSPSRQRLVLGRRNGILMCAHVRSVDLRSKSFLRIETSSTGVQIPSGTYFTFSGILGACNGGKRFSATEHLALVLIKQDQNFRLRGVFRDSNFVSLAGKLSADKNRMRLKVVALRKGELEKFASIGGQDSPICDLETTSYITDREQSPHKVAAAVTGHVLELATDTDYEFTTYYGSATAAQAQVALFVQFLNTYYRRQAGISFVLSFQHSWSTSNDPYIGTSMSTRLTEFSTYWIANFAQIQTYDLAHLVSAAQINGGAVGIATLGGACSTNRYSVSHQALEPPPGAVFVNPVEVFLHTTIQIMSHEIGHSLNASHDQLPANPISHAYIMAPYTNMNFVFSATSVSEMRNFLNQRNCDLEEQWPDPVNAPPFVGPFQNATLSEVMSGSNGYMVGLTPPIDPDGHFLDTFVYSFSPAASWIVPQFDQVLHRWWAVVSPPLDFVDSCAAGNPEFVDHTVTVTVWDPTGREASAPWRIRVNNTNQSPVIERGDVPSSTVTVPPGSAVNFTLAGTDPDCNSLTYFTIPSSGSEFVNLNSATGEFGFTAPQTPGFYIAVFKVRDSNNAQSANNVIAQFSVPFPTPTATPTRTAAPSFTPFTPATPPPSPTFGSPTLPPVGPTILGGIATATPAFPATPTPDLAKILKVRVKSGYLNLVVSSPAIECQVGVYKLGKRTKAVLSKLLGMGTWRLSTQNGKRYKIVAQSCRLDSGAQVNINFDRTVTSKKISINSLLGSK